MGMRASERTIVHMYREGTHTYVLCNTYREGTLYVLLITSIKGKREPNDPLCYVDDGLSKAKSWMSWDSVTFVL